MTRSSPQEEAASSGSSSGATSADGTPAIWTTLELVRWTSDYFARAGVASPRLDAEVLLAHTLRCRRLDLYLQFERPVEPQERATYRELVKRRARDRVPVAQLTGEREFWSHTFSITPDVLIPRPETELLVELAAGASPGWVLDFGTGSGNIAISLALQVDGVRVVALDRSRAALGVAKRNVVRHSVCDRVFLLHAAALDALALGLRFDVIVSNPPYIATADLAGLAPELAHEPRSALDGGPDGLDVIRGLLDAAPRNLAAGGRLMIEVGAGQAGAVAELARARGAEADVHKDLAGIERVVSARFQGGARC